MTPRLYFELVLLSAIWGGSFILTRVLAPNIGAVFAAVFLGDTLTPRKMGGCAPVLGGLTLLFYLPAAK